MKKELHDLHGSAPDRSDAALLILDMISDFEFVGGAQVFRAALPVARRIAELKQHAVAADIPVIYVNDNAGRWRSDFPALVRRCSRRNVRGSTIARLLKPAPTDYCVLKPKHSGFFATALDTLLQYLGCSRLVLTGVSSHQCVLFTANDAYVRDFSLHIPRDCITAESAAESRFALKYFRSVLEADVRPSTSLRWPEIRNLRREPRKLAR